MTGEIAERVKREDWSVVAPGHTIAATEVPYLLLLMSDENRQVRQLTVRCLAVAGGADAIEGLLQALSDESDMVRATAARMLRQYAATVDRAAVREIMTEAFDEYVREQLARLLGETGDTEQIPFLRAQLGGELDVDVRSAIAAALARLGDEAYRGAMIALLEQESSPKVKLQALEDLVYIGDWTLARRAVPCLDDDRPAMVGGYSAAPRLLRVCDLAVDQINRLLGGMFPFAGAGRQYSDAELWAVKAALNALG